MEYLARFWLMFALYSVFVGVAPAEAADLRNVLSGYTLTSWGQKDGLPPGPIFAVAQDREGYLWVGTSSGAMRFDGVRFVLWQATGTTRLPEGPVRSLRAARDGSLWVGFGGRGFVSRVKNGVVHNYGEADGLVAGAVTALDEDSNGDIWAGTRDGLFRFANDRWEGAGRGLPQVNLYRTYAHASGAYFVATAVGLFRRSPHESVFHRVGKETPVLDLVYDAFDHLWVTDVLKGFRAFDKPRDHISLSGRGSSLLHDTKGNLWVGTWGEGLWRLRLDATSRLAKVERIGAGIGFSSGSVISLLEDREGNIWVGTFTGLNRLVPHKVTPVLDLGVTSGIEEGLGGGVWVGAVDTLLRFEPGTTKPRREPQAFHGNVPSAMHADRSGHLWVATETGLLKIDAEGRATRQLVSSALRRINAITSDLQDTVWLADLDQGIFQLIAGRLEPLPLPPELHGVPVTGSLGDRSGRVWFLFANGRVALVHKDRKVAVHGDADSKVGVYRAIYEDDDQTIWIGGDHGLSRFDRGKFLPFGRSSGFPDGSVIAINGDRSGALWVGLDGVGVVRVAPEDLERTHGDGFQHVRYAFYDQSDGYAGTPRWFGNSSTARSEDGRLWFISRMGVTIIDPDTLEVSQPSTARVSIDGVLADGQPMEPRAGLRLPQGTSQIQIDYTFPSLTSALKTRFRYRLDGFDADWVEAGTRRQALYTNLSAGSYRLQVIASTDDGGWTEPSALFDFSIAPYLHERPWFLAGCGVIVILVAGGGWRFRAGQLRRRFSILMGERARLSREIHDTLLQGLFGVSLQCDVIARDVDRSSPADIRERLGRLHLDAERYLREARQSIADLRSPKPESGALPEALRRMAQRTIEDRPITFQLAVTGTSSQRWTDVEEQLLRIGQEAMLNAVRHAHARQIRMELHCAARVVVLRIVDDGTGFELNRVSDGHFGLLSMKERAEVVGGSLSVVTGDGRGTEIEASIPIRRSFFGIGGHA